MAAVKRIEIVGPGCERCLETVRLIRAVVASAGLACEVVHASSAERTSRDSADAVPAVLVDGQVAIVGRVPHTDEIRQIIGVG